MTKRKTMASIEAEITKLKTQLDNLEKRRERLIAQIALAQKERDQRLAEAIFEAFRKSEKTYRQLMTFLGQ